MSDDDASQEERQLRPRRTAESSAAAKFAAASKMDDAAQLKAAMMDSDDDEADYDFDGDVADVERLGDKSQAVAEEKERKRADRAAAKADREAARKAAREAAAAEKKKAKAAQTQQSQKPIDSTQRTLAGGMDGTGKLNIDAALAALHKVDAEADESAANFDFNAFLARERDDDDDDDDDAPADFDVNRVLGITTAEAPAAANHAAPTPAASTGLDAQLEDVVRAADPVASAVKDEVVTPAKDAAAGSGKKPKKTVFSSAPTAVKQEQATVVKTEASSTTPEQSRNFAVKHEVKQEATMVSMAGGLTGASSPQDAAAKKAAAGLAMPQLLQDGQFEMYWLDAREQPHYASVDPGSVMLFGKCKAQSGQWVSCCLRIKHMQRCVLCAPREGSAELDVVKDISALCRDRGITERRVKKVDRWYGFEDEDTPRDKTGWLKLRYDAKHPPLFDAPQVGNPLPSTAHVRQFYGVNRSLIELLLIKRRFKGPSYVNVTEPVLVPAHERLSHCEIEMMVDSPKNVTPKQTSAAHPAPTLTAVSIQLHAQLDTKKHVNEIFGVAMTFLPVEPESSTRTLDTAVTMCAFRPPQGTAVPFEFRQVSDKSGLRNVRTFGNEAALLNWVVQQLKDHDPDMLVGHNFLAFTLDVLLHRLAANRNPDWSVLGRLKLRVMPKLQTGAGGTREATYQEREVCVGRLVVDTYMLAREHHRTTNYKLIAIARELQIRGLFSAGDIAGNIEEQPDVQTKETFDCDRLLTAFKYALNCSMLALALTNRLDFVPLTRTLCSLAGNLWSRTLNGSRSERIEYLLLHAFHHVKFVTPDRRPPGFNAAAKAAAVGGVQVKRERDGTAAATAAATEQEGGAGFGLAADPDDAAAAGTAAAEEAAQDDADDQPIDAANNAPAAAAATATKRKAKYQGGMVLEPKTGLYKEHILLLDFNSLYPSIIQEFDICFTTIRRREGEVPTIPTAEDLVCNHCRENGSVPAGKACPHRCLLPKVIHGLVASRRDVKRMMKTEKDPNLLNQMEIRQKALKLTANSMYGCLGFEFSRFYAQALAELVTEKGREALGKACEIVEGTQLEDGTRLDVVYGDTDSVMIRTQTRDLARVREIAHRVQNDVNKRYTKLEIGIDGVFCSMLLHKKKKYAALTVEDFMGEGKVIKREVKGLDMVRRDWCPLTKMSCSNVLDVLLDHKMSADDAIEKAMADMKAMADQLRVGRTYELQHFCVSKSLTRDPELYKDQNQAHVQVALRMKARSEQIRSGDIVPYVICKETFEEAAAATKKEEEEAQTAGGVKQEQPSAAENDSANAITTSTSKLAARAFHVDEVKKNPRLHVDVDWYLTTQILPPVSRLCEHVEGFSNEQLADAMGIAAHFAAMNQATGGATRADADAGYASSAFRGVSLEDAFPLAEPLHAQCQGCNKFTRIHPHEHLANLVEATANKRLISSQDLARSGSRGGVTKHEFRERPYRCLHCNKSVENAELCAATMLATHKARRDFYNAGGDEAARERVKQQLTYLRALFDVPRGVSGVINEAHQNALRYTRAPNFNHLALVDQYKVTEATWNQAIDEPALLATAAYESLFGQVVHCDDLLAPMFL